MEASPGFTLFKSCAGSPLTRCRDKCLLLLEVNEVLVVLEDLDIRERSPCFLQSLSSNSFLSLRWSFPLSLLMTSPSPLDLDSCYVVHCEPVILKQPSRQSHFIGCLYDGSTEVSPALLLRLVKNVEWRSKELRSKPLVWR